VTRIGDDTILTAVPEVMRGRPDRLILFDIDGTLVRGGPAREAFGIALEASFGTTGAIDRHDFAGKTDPQIARELLVADGLKPEQVEEGFPRLWARYLAELEARLAFAPMETLPGVGGLLAELEEAQRVALGLVTGNIASGAQLKLGSVGLTEYFRVGGFGSDNELRDHLPAIAIGRACEAWGREFRRAEVWIVGDTPLDVSCGRHAGVRTLAVATGRHSTEELEACRPDEVVENLRDVGGVLLTLLG
jgi:phosphoglycolate phosphatase-like HAD superfamily hydrolase